MAGAGAAVGTLAPRAHEGARCGLVTGATLVTPQLEWIAKTAQALGSSVGNQVDQAGALGCAYPEAGIATAAVFGPQRNTTVRIDGHLAKAKHVAIDIRTGVMQ